MAAVAEVPVGHVPGQFVDWVNSSQVAEQVESSSNTLITDLAKMIGEYTGDGSVGAFALNFWQQRGINAGAVRPIDPKFYEYWHGPDPVDPTHRVCDTHHWPVWIPEGLSLRAVERAGLRFDPNDTQALQQHGNTPIGGGYYAVMRKEVLGRDLPEAEQIQQLNKAGYPGLAQAADVAAVMFAIKEHNGNRWLGDNTGAENRWTYTRCVERVVFGGREHPLVIGSSTPSGVDVNANFGYDYEYFGVAALRKF